MPMMQAAGNLDAVAGLGPECTKYEYKLSGSPPPAYRDGIRVYDSATCGTFYSADGKQRLDVITDHTGVVISIYRWEKVNGQPWNMQ